MKIKEYREARGMTQKDLAIEMGLDQSAVCLWESGKTRPRAKLLPKLAKVLHCTADELLSGETKEVPE